MDIRMIDVGSGLMLEVDFGKIARINEVREHVENIGARNILMDSHASIVRKDFESDADYRAEKLAVASKKLEMLYAGNVRARIAASIRTPVDPIGKEALREARVFVGTNAKGWESGKDSAIAWLTKIADIIGAELPETPNSNDWKELVQKAIEYRAAKPSSIETARKIVELRAVEVAVEI